jgi:DNA polymerase-3 subunit delta
MAKARESAQPRVAAPPPVLDGSAAVYMFFGDEPFLRRLYLNQLTARALGLKSRPAAGEAAGQEAGMAISQFDGSEITLAAVLDELRTLPFLAERRIVIVDAADTFVSEHRPALEKYLEKPSPTGVLVLLVQDPRTTSNLYKAVAARGGAVACQKLAQSDLARWIRERAKDTYAKTIDYETSALLADLVGDDLDRLDSELAKLSVYLGQRKTITPGDVDELVANQRLHDAFELTGAIASKDAAAALLRWNDMLSKDSEASYRSVGLIAWQIRQLLRARSLRNQGLSRDEVLSRLHMPYFVRDKFIEQVSKFPERRLRGLLGELVKLDLASKTGGAPANRGIELFIMHACQPDQPQA